MNRPIVIGILLFLIAFSGLFFFIRSRSAVQEPSAKETQSKSSNQDHRRKINVELYFGTPGTALLAPETRSIPYHETLHAQAKEVLTALMEGPKQELVPTIPQGVRLLDILVTEDGIAYVDLSGEIVSNHQGGTAGEMITVYSIVNTLTTNLPQIRGVQILVDDRAVDTLVGHLDLSRPLKPDLSMAQPEQEPKGKDQASQL